MREGLKFMAKRKANTKESLQEQAEMILQLAEKKGVSTKYFFKTTFQRYQMQMEILGKLEDAIKENGPTVEKYYMDTDAEVREVITNSDGSKTVNTTLKDGTYKVEEINAAGKTIGTERTTLDGTVISNRFNDDGTRKQKT